MFSPLGSRTTSALTTSPGPHQDRVDTHLLVRWSLGESPFSPKMVMKTLASVPAPRTSPVAVTTSYTGGGKKTDGKLRRKPRILCGLGEATAPSHKGLCEALLHTTFTKSCCETKIHHLMLLTHFTGMEPTGRRTSPGHILYSVKTRAQPQASVVFPAQYMGTLLDVTFFRACTWLSPSSLLSAQCRCLASPHLP